jgi:hypothetical protein
MRRTLIGIVVGIFALFAGFTCTLRARQNAAYGWLAALLIAVGLLIVVASVIFAGCAANGPI